MIRGTFEVLAECLLPVHQAPMGYLVAKMGDRGTKKRTGHFTPYAFGRG